MIVKQTRSKNVHYSSILLHSTGNSPCETQESFISGDNGYSTESSDVASACADQSGLAPTISKSACTHTQRSSFRLYRHVSVVLAVIFPVVFHVMPVASPEALGPKPWQFTAAYATSRRMALSTIPTSDAITKSLPQHQGIVNRTVALLTPQPTGITANIQSYVLPARGEFTSSYGQRWGRLHRGIDIAGPVGTPIVAASAGKVIAAGWGGGFGYKVEIRHPDGTVTLYAHASKLLTKVGAHVRQGEMIAEMGSSGNSTGSHLHFQIHPGGKEPVNPAFFFGEALKLACASTPTLATKGIIPQLTKGEGCYSNEG
jgi:murein DD-endopeptidase MepM/ murein hydrolase activator NlpD